MCVLILYNEFKKAGAANRVPFLNTETTEEEETAFSQRTISAPEPGHCILHKWCTASLQLPSQPSLGWWLANFLPPAKSIFHQHVGRTDRMGLGCGEEWHGFLFFFFWSEAMQTRRWPGASDGGSLGWSRQACCCDEGTEVHQEHRRSESVLKEETQSWDLPLCLNLYLILVKSWTFSGRWIPPKQVTTSSY